MDDSRRPIVREDRLGRMFMSPGFPYDVEHRPRIFDFRRLVPGEGGMVSAEICLA